MSNGFLNTIELIYQVHQMNFFILKTTSEKKIIGSEFPQIQTMDGTVNRKAHDSVYNVYSNEFPDFIPNLNYFVLHKNAKLTDILSAAMIDSGFILNDKVKIILEQHKLPPHKFYPATVEHNGTFHDNYYWFFYVCDVLDFIDYDKTKFFITDLIDNKIDDCKNVHSVNNFKSLKEILPDDRSVNSDLIYLKKSLAEKYDLFKITFGNYRTYVSERLSNALKENKITGVAIATTNKISI